MKSAIVLAAGYGTRLRPLSSQSSKSMVSLNGKPVIQHILNQIVKYPDIKEIIIVQNDIGDIEKFINETCLGKRLGVNIKFARQVDQHGNFNPKGPLEAIRYGFEKVDKSTRGILIWLGDTLIFDKNFNLDHSFVGVQTIDGDKSRWCLINERTQTIYDKPSNDVPTDLALVGIYNFIEEKDHNIFYDVFDRVLKESFKRPKIKGEYQISNLLNQWMENDYLGVEKVNEWYDIGELSSFYKTRAHLINRSSRDFNTIELDTKLNILTKRGYDRQSIQKIEQEKNWYENLKEHQRFYVPNIITESDKGKLTMSFEPGISLNELFLYENLSDSGWREILGRVLDVYKNVFYNDVDIFGIYSDLEFEHDCELTYTQFSLERFEENKQFFKEHLGELDIKNIENFIQNSQRTGIKTTCMHGDLHFGNIIFEPFTGNFKWVDPKGYFGDHIGTGGDAIYDLAKLMQTPYTGYEHMLKGIKNWDDTFDEQVYYILYDLIQERWGKDIAERARDRSILLLINCIKFHIKEDKDRAINFIKRANQLIKDYEYSYS